MTRKICYITGTRADFGLMESTLKKISRDNDLSLHLIVTGMHLSKLYGYTIEDIVSSGLHIECVVELDLEPPIGKTMAINIGKMIVEFTEALASLQPDIVLLLGDRGEMLAGAIAAIHLNLPVFHIHGGERSGTVDEPVRHAISKLSHYHFVATIEAKDRLIAMGENPDSVHWVGAPGLDEIEQLAQYSKAELCREFRVPPSESLALLVFHPVLQEEKIAGQQVELLIEIMLSQGFFILAILPNSDAGSHRVRDVLLGFSTSENVIIIDNLDRMRFLSLIKCADVMVGNSSAGIIEAASFGTPVLNVGSRQRMRERNMNVIDCNIDREEISISLVNAKKQRRFPIVNVYGDGRSGNRIVQLIKSIVISEDKLVKCNAY